MTGRLISASHSFTAPDEAWARGLVEALVAYGFPLVVAGPGKDGWDVAASDGPYPNDIAGLRTEDAVGRQASAIARRHGGCPTLHGSMPADHFLENLANPSRLVAALQRSTDPSTAAWIVRVNPDARPPLPAVVVTPAPPAAALGLTPDTVAATEVDLRPRPQGWCTTGLVVGVS
jgi:hypothetical protein